MVTNNVADIYLVERPPLYTEVAGNLWVGAHPPQHQLVDAKFFGVICLTPFTGYQLHPHQALYQQPMSDSDYVPDNIEGLAQVAREISELGPTLVHCSAGINRSPFVVGLALIRGGMAPQEVIDLMRNKRSPSVLFNKTFEGYLLNGRG